MFTLPIISLAFTTRPPLAMSLALGICVFLGIAGCRSVSSYTQWDGRKTCLCFLEETDTSFEAELWPHTKQEAAELLPKFALTEEEIRHIETDPFHCDPYRRVRFDFSSDPFRMAEYYAAKAKEHGWVYVRGILLTELTNSGGDWLEVYRKGSSLVRIHIMGYHTIPAEELEKLKPSIPIRFIHFDFLDTSPSDFFECFGCPITK